jgi:signal transduction histidine kinase/CheY-like chemotaxis protein
MYDSARRLLGFYNAPFETTYQTVSTRRTETLQRLGEATSAVRSVRNFWKAIMDGLESNPYDINFATIYVLADPEGSDSTSVTSGSNTASKDCVLEGTIGVPSNHAATPPRIELQSDVGLTPHMRAAVQTKEPVLLSARKGMLPDFLLEGINFRGFEIPSSEILILPLRSTSQYNASAILTLGLNPRRRYDSDYKTFIAMLDRQLSTSLASVLFAEDESRRNRTAAELAALQREHLTEQLELQRSRLRRMTEHSPLGMFLISPDGVLLEANERYYEMTNHPREAYSLSFMETVAESNATVALRLWDQLVIERKPVAGDLLLSHNYNTEVDESGALLEPWVLVSAVPEMSSEDEVRSVMGSITDISHYRYARRLQEQRLREAEETKRQQNAFIDITSHELRNPLSAMLICADDIRNSLLQHSSDIQNARLLADCLEAAETIALCAQHQKTIVDDVLTISKLNSNLLVIAPLPSDPVQVIRSAMNMFTKECQTKQISLSLNLHPSMGDLNIARVMLDPGRMSQIVVNLLTNAIKFTQQKTASRSISVHVGASFSPPIPNTKTFEYVPRRNPQVEISNGEDWGADQVIYLRVKITDTGCGLTPEEKQRLFERFSQASPRTHAQYGGSGLGLFISRQLAELHGGQIGAASEAGVGSTFGFFIQCRKTVDSEVQKEAPLSNDTKSMLPTSTFERYNASESQLTNPTQNVRVTKPSPIIEITGIKAIHVLVVEDNLVNQRILKKQLEKFGCIVATADNGIEALKYLRTTDLYSSGTNPISIILMDLEMPEMGGLECVTHIRKFQADGLIQRHVPVVAVTANVRAEQMLAARQSGMDDIVSKPFKIADLLRKIEGIVGATTSQRSP